VPSHAAQARLAAEMTTRRGRLQPSPLASCASQRRPAAAPTQPRPPVAHRRRRTRRSSRRSVQRCTLFGNASVRRCARRRLSWRRLCAR
jgi:hypothetical protein